MKIGAHAMRIIKLCIGAIVAMGLVAAGFANADENEAGTTAANFLTVGANPRILSMGGASLGLGNEIGSVTWNAAALGWVGQTELVLSHAGMANESSQEWAAIGGRWGEGNTRWSLSGLYQGDGTFEGRDASNNPTGSFGASSIAIGGHLAHQFGDMITVGFGAKSVSEKLADVTGQGFTFDGGVMVKKGPVGFGLAAQNLLGQMKYGSAIYQFPTNYGAGLGVEVPGTGLRFALDANFPSNYYKDVRTGVEWMWSDMIAVRAGYRSELGSSDDALSGPTFGLGAGKNGFWMDYGYLISNNGEGQHRVGLKLLPSAWNMASMVPVGQRGAKGQGLASRKTAIAPEAEPKKAKKSEKPKSEPAAASTTPKASPSAAVTVPTTKQTAVPVQTSAPKSLPQVVAPSSVVAPAPAPKVVPASPSAAIAPVAPAQAAPVAPAPAPSQVAPAPAAPAPVAPAAPAPAPAAPAPSQAAPVAIAPPQAQPAPAPAAPAPTQSAPAPAAPAPAPTPPAPAPAPPAQAPPVAEEPRPEKIKVKDGDTLASLARRWDTSAPAIMMLNNMVSEQVKPGQVIKLPPKGRY
jgi:LysM repeat protein